MMINKYRNSAVTTAAGQRGFTLTEIAIVLGIIGLILGAIWVAAASVYQNMRVSKATSQFLTIAQNVRAMYATSSVVDAGADMTLAATGTGAALTYLSAGIFPSDTVNAARTAALNPWTGNIAVKSGQSTLANDSFIIGMNNVPSAACIALLTSITGAGADPGYRQAWVAASDTAFAISDLAAATSIAAGSGNVLGGVSASNAATLCGSGVVKKVAFGFTLK